MGQVTGSEGSVTFTGGGLDLTDCQVNVSEVTENNPMDRSVGFGSANMVSTALVSSWTASVNFNYPSAPKSGVLGSATWNQSGIVADVRGYTLNISVQERDTTGLGDTYASYLPIGAIDVSGTIESFIDDATDIDSVVVPGATSSTLTLALTDRTNDNLSFGAFLSETRTNIARDGSSGLNSSFVANGAITAGAGAFISGLDALPTVGTLTVNGDSTMSGTGSAFWTNVTLNVSRDGVVNGTATLRGTGEWTPLATS